ncbi:globin [Methylocaldum sp.]|uniref:globin n=1 Tax=Methylocaldum sp. TaxID=1969727 RepID=UPI002D41B93F|nr:globin [Methylocaldum sp.]HYE36847.1 globin [Methylocaldum sp.]
MNNTAEAIQAADIDNDKILKEMVDKSYTRCRLTGTFIDDFYNAFVASSPKIEEKFRKTNWDTQKKLLDQGIRHLILFFYEPSSVTAEKMIQLGESHSRSGLNIEPELYDFWISALMATVAESDPKFNPELEKAWEIVVERGISVLKSMYDE